MPSLSDDKSIKLREQAHARLKHTSGLDTTRASSAHALRVLHDLAASADTAADALALLHELQVHQVELDLQAEEAKTANLDLETALARHVQLFEAAPIAYYVLDDHLQIRDVNALGCERLGRHQDQLKGQRLDVLIPSGLRTALNDVLLLAHKGQGKQACNLHWPSKDDVSRTVCITASPDPAGQGLLVLMNDLPPAHPTIA